MGHHWQGDAYALVFMLLNGANFEATSVIRSKKLNNSRKNCLNFQDELGFQRSSNLDGYVYPGSYKEMSYILVEK
jgi:hypothetical protein